MAKRTSLPPQLRSATLTPDQLRSGITKLERRIADLKAFDVNTINRGSDPAVLALQASIAQTLETVFGADTTDYDRYKNATKLVPTAVGILVIGSGRHTGPNVGEIRRDVLENCRRAIALLEQAARSLREELGDLGETASGRALRAYEGLALHPEIARAATALYSDGHYANAVQDAVKALVGLVRLRSGSDLDGTRLMESVFSPNNPVLKFNPLASQSDRDEQKGFMMLFSGAVMGFRNARAHEFITDDPERALECIACVSLLAKLLDQASK